MDWGKVLSTKRLRESTRIKDNCDMRNEFESDYGRIVFSPAIRRMHDKTQVFPLISDDNIHTRLTHSLEVSTIARSIGLNICNQPEFRSKIPFIPDKDIYRIIPTILESVSLCHDIGNPPFGHYGEKIIQNYFKELFSNNSTLTLDEECHRKDFELFNGNAQGFRILTKLQILQDLYGLNLTYGTLSAFLKYPNLSNDINSDSKGYHKKLGVFQSEREYCKKIKTATELNNIRNPLAFLMEAADSICYLTMDIEDAFNSDVIHYQSIIEHLSNKGNSETKKIIQNITSKIDSSIMKDSNKERTKIVKLRIALIQKLVNIACKSFIKNIDKIEAGEYEDELIFDSTDLLAKTLQSFAVENIFKHRKIVSLELTGESVLRGLLDHFVQYIVEEKYTKRAEKSLALISKSIKHTITEETGEKNLLNVPDYYKLRMIVDYITGMTDFFALNLFQKLEGIKIA